MSVKLFEIKELEKKMDSAELTPNPFIEDLDTPKPICLSDRTAKAEYELMHGEKTVNQIRKDFGLEPIDMPGADECFIAASVLSQKD